MAASSTQIPSIRSDLVIQQIADSEYVVKLPSRRKYFSIGRPEHFLLTQLGPDQTRESLRQAYQQEFDEELSEADLDDFFELVRSAGLIDKKEETGSKKTSSAEPSDRREETDADSPSSPRKKKGMADRLPGQGSLLFYRVSLYDPNRLFGWLEPKIRWIWTRAFLVTSLVVMGCALCTMLANSDHLVSSFPQVMRWETIVVVTLVMVTATILHEFAHGLTCKHFGGDVHELGVLIMFGIPCMYCNVSDAWLIREKWKRLLITAAGGYCDMCLWAASVFVWRITVETSFVNYLALLVCTVCGSRGLINFNPLLRLDGYYLVSDWLAIPNLRRRAQEMWMQYMRWFLWGAPAPVLQRSDRPVLFYGMFAWVFAIALLDMGLIRFLGVMSRELGTVGILLSVALLAYALRRVFRGFFRSEFVTMITERRKRTLIWMSGIATTVAILFLFPIGHYATGDFEVRPGDLYDIRSSVSGFVRDVYVEEGCRVSAGDPLVRLDSPELENQIATKSAELKESEAQLAKLELGPRPEELRAARDRVERLQTWVDDGRRQLDRAGTELEHELRALNQQIEQTNAQLEFSKSAIVQSQRLYKLGALAGAQLRSEQTQLAVLGAALSEIQARRAARATAGTRLAEAELSRREHQLADALDYLKLLEAGTRQEDIAAEKARQDRLQQELTFLHEQKKKLIVRATVDGIVATPRMQDKKGQYSITGTPICVIEDCATSRIEISISQDQIGGLQPGQPVRLKARSLPFETLDATVDRVAPGISPSALTSATTVQPPPQSDAKIVVYCKLDNEQGQLKPGMTGFGRVYRSHRSVGTILFIRAMRYVRTEFWW